MPVNLNDSNLQAALNRVNFYRGQAGVAACSLNAALVTSAQNHADYFRQNPSQNDPHGETAGKPGFTGASWVERTKAAGYTNSESTNENVTYIADPVKAVDWFMATVNHRAPLLDPTYPDIGFGFATAPDGKGSICVIDFGLPIWKDTFDPTWVIYPPDNLTAFPQQSWKEEPDPFAAYPAKFPIGNPILIMYRGAGDITYEANLFSLVDTNGNKIAIYSLPKLTMFATRKGAALASQQPLQPATTYAVTVGYNLAGHSTQMRTWHFSTGSSLTTGSSLFEKANLTNADPTVSKLWLTADGPVANGSASHSWLYGPSVFDERTEPYLEAQLGQRKVYYFDKARMEITNPLGERNSQWFVSTGRLVAEMISGQVQVGNSKFEGRAPADVPVAGDPAATNPEAPTYASWGAVASLNNDKRAPNRSGQTVLETINKAGQVQILSAGPASVKYSYYDTTLGHNVPDVIINWAARLPSPWVFLLGLPLSEPYWARVKVGGVEKDVLTQVFERRTVTYTPTNDVAYQVEMGNVGRHYHVWRYGS